ncbi:DUF3717 domain-containing protein [Noviherbaspirillum denitrificans]|uniref:DUF3717 domain-containing protein n=1 Tax=Noviherbaspirillum denitrificans TaxID=1968433 RepID=A0A254TN21_9BURK|nr:DUF3717 domain-containing protein [Noviherbaspirillum denitrificans]OWW21108.1 hypothetical protein AYR66_18135 [Noviherbaspirillum denitrificans]
MDITLAELEEAINYWRALRPSSGEECALSPEVNALADVYAMMIYTRSRSMPFDSMPPAARQLVDAWRNKI